MTASRTIAGNEPGSPLLAPADAPVEAHADVDALARRLHQLRQGAALDCEPAFASLGADPFPGVFVWRRTGADAARRFLAFAAGPGLDAPADLLAALRRTARRPTATRAAA